MKNDLPDKQDTFGAEGDYMTAGIDGLDNKKYDLNDPGFPQDYQDGKTRQNPGKTKEKESVWGKC